MNIIWVGRAIGIVSSGLALVKLANHFLKIGFVGISGFILDAYVKFVGELQYWLVELPFQITPQDWVKHCVVVWTLFVGSNFRFLTNNNHGECLLTGFGDVGRGTRRGTMSPWSLRIWIACLSLTGPIFSIFVFLMWLGNRQMGPTGRGHWGDRFMIANRVYTLRISRVYLFILSLAPITTALFLAWGAAKSLP